MKVIEVLMFLYEECLMSDILIRDKNGKIFKIESMECSNGDVIFNMGINVLKV